MHPALQIDEIFRQILSYAAYSKKDLVSLAQVCRSWKDASLDFAWENLPSLFPILNLVLNSHNQSSEASATYDTQTFLDYTRRVRQLTHRHTSGSDLDQAHNLLRLPNHNTPLLPRLISLSLSFRNWIPLYQSLAFSPNIQCLEFDLGFNSQAQTQANEAHRFLANVLVHAHDLQELRIRGKVSACFHELISLMQNVRKLSLRTGTSLTARAVLELARLPSLVELDMHVGHLTADDVIMEDKESTFPSLSSLRLRAKSTSISAILTALPQNKLIRLWLEAQDDTHTSVDWNDILGLVSTKVSTILEFVKLEHHVEIIQDDAIIDIPTNDPSSQPSPIATVSASSVPGGNLITSPPLSLQSFNKLRALKVLELEMTIPPTFEEADLRDLCSGCPNLEILNLGGSSCFELKAATKITEPMLQCFLPLKKLTSLVLPGVYAAGQTNTFSEGAQCNLRSLTLTQVTYGDGTSLARHLKTLFPSLETIDGSPKYDDIWNAARVELTRL
ncbi:hypothetical protein NP233_g7245 [Leucocoprinus birnbaumii]|uniref:F-box domain-containing protein n=1 Tax=Leucocoprinus birnbaumii TaxID=56174 RepID=A0AAD5VRT0_9AGAR|nr:hypothetical protein NP233_g7245 [Leucocoprinus birnbaumii]